MTHRVVDTFAVLAWLQDEAGAAQMERLMREAATGEARLEMSSINVGEVYYRLIKAGRAADAEQFLLRVMTRELPIVRVSATDARVDRATKLKAQHPISYADAFAVGLATEHGIPLVTNDPEIMHLAELGLVKIEQLRR